MSYEILNHNPKATRQYNKILDNAIFNCCRQIELEEKIEMLNFAIEAMAQKIDPTFYQLTNHFEKMVTQHLKLKWRNYNV